MALSNSSIAIKNIVVPTDFSRASERAVRFAAIVARRYKSVVQLVHVLAPQYFLRAPAIPIPGPPVPAVDSVTLARHAAKGGFEELKQSGVLRGISHNITIRITRGSLSLPELIILPNTDLIVMASQGPTGLRRLLHASVAEEMLRTAYCPLLILGPRCEEQRAPAIRKIVYAAGSPHKACRALSWANWLRADFGARGIALEVRSSETTLPVNLRAGRGLAGARLETRLLTGPFTDAVLRFVRRNSCDLLVIGVHPRNEASIRNAYRLVCKAPCPVLSVRVSLKILSA